MSSTGTAIPHLTQQRLSPKDKAIMEGLEDWLSSAEFEPITNICTDKRLSEKWALLREMDLAKKVGILSQCQNFS